SQQRMASATASNSAVSHFPISEVMAERGTLTIWSTITWEALRSPVRVSAFRRHDDDGAPIHSRASAHFSTVVHRAGTVNGTGPAGRRLRRIDRHSLLMTDFCHANDSPA